jgi:hypothetical protein
MLRRTALLTICLVASLLGCTGDPVGEAPSDGDVDSTTAGDAPIGSDASDTRGSETKPPSETSVVPDTRTGDADATAITHAGKPCAKTLDCDPSGTNGAQCLTEAPTPICYGAKCSPVTSGTTLSTCPDDGVCLDDGAGGGLCVPLCYFDGTSGAMAQDCLGNDACWYVDTAVIGGKGYAYGRCEGRCGSDDDCPAGTKCQDDGACVVTPKVFAGAKGDACAATDDGVKCACVYGLGTKTGYCSKFCRVGGPACPAGYTCDADVPASFGSIIPNGVLGNCLKDCTADGECTNAYCEQHAGVATKTCQPGAR